MTDERLTPEQGLVEMGLRSGAEIAVNVPDRALAERLVREVGAAFAEGARRGAAERAAQADEPDPDPGTVVGTVRPITPDEIRARRWAE